MTDRAPARLGGAAGTALPRSSPGGHEERLDAAIPLPLRAAAPDLSADEQLERATVERCLGGDRDAFAVLVRRHGPGVNALCARMVGRAIGEELAQETFARAWSGLASFRRDARLRHWLYRIALNLCRDHLKSGRAREDATGNLAEGAFEPADGQADPERRAVGRQEVAALQRAVETLSPKYKEAFVLKHVENLSYEEMRTIVKMPIPALKVRVHRAREMLKKKLLADPTGGAP